MTDYVRDALETQLADLKRKLAKREDQPGFAANVAEIRVAIAALEAELASRVAES